MTRFKRLRHASQVVGGWFSQSEWIVRLLNLARAEEPRTERGLVLIQIDGLGLTEFQRGLQKGDLPFLKWLGSKPQGYVSVPHYSGLPSNTPGVQGELFYGVKMCVPAFSFVDRTTNRVCHLFESSTADAVEARLAKAGEPLLAAGSSYGNIFSGGAKAAHFCSTSMGWTDMVKGLNPVSLSLAIVLNLHIVIRAALLAALELVLAVADCARGIVSTQRLRKELEFIPLRVLICIVLREVVTVAAKVDIARGLRIIHVNLAGYDEQAHHRGPHSGLARWSLKGVDHAIRRLWTAAHRASRRDYDVWIYSDHGQEHTLPYAKEHGRSIQEAVSAVFEGQLKERGWGIEHAQGTPHWRASLLWASKLATPGPEAGEKTTPPRVIVAAMGPIGHIYAPEGVSAEARSQLAEALVREAKIPIVMAAAGAGQAQAWTAEGSFELPKEADKVVGKDHPYLAEVSEDLVGLCHHPDAGTFVILAWRAGNPGTFPMEFGSHAGPGHEETNGFAHLPKDAVTLPKDRTYVRNADLRAAAQRVLKHAS